MTISPAFRRQALRAAIKIHERLLIPSRIDPLDHLPRYAWEQLRLTLWRLRKVEVRGWQEAARRVLDDIDFETRELIRQLEVFHTNLPRPRGSSQVAPLSQVMADLLALDEEFDEVTIELDDKTVTVRTEPITLEGLYLGSFDICLHWDRIGVSHPYQVIAQDSQAPTDQEDVTHPHVRDQHLCEGDGAVPIRSALASGRLFDFFLVVHQTLQTYNPTSPYVSVKNWNGSSCRDCGYGLSEDEGSTCERCDGTLCSECGYSCQDCGRSLCSECSDNCAECDERFCSACLDTRAGTDQLLCPTCLKKGPSTDDHDQSPGPAPAVHAVRLGQTAAAA